MNAPHLIESLKRFANVLPAVVRDLTPAEARWRPADGAWSILEVVTHLADEEVEDFRARLELTLGDPVEPWPPTDPEAWAVQRRYNEGDLHKVVARFVAERRASVQWLAGLEAPDLSKAYDHPKWGPIRAGDILVSWAAHDALHLRQMAKRLFQLAQHHGGAYTTDYAGSWTA